MSYVDAKNIICVQPEMYSLFENNKMHNWKLNFKQDNLMNCWYAYFNYATIGMHGGIDDWNEGANTLEELIGKLLDRLGDKDEPSQCIFFTLVVFFYESLELGYNIDEIK